MNPLFYVEMYYYIRWKCSIFSCGLLDEIVRYYYQSVRCVYAVGDLLVVRLSLSLYSVVVLAFFDLWQFYILALFYLKYFF